MTTDFSRSFLALPVAAAIRRQLLRLAGQRRLLRLLSASVGLLAVLAGCAGMQSSTDTYPPILAADEIPRTYVKLAVLDVHNDRFGAVEGLVPEDYTWAYQALRQEAARIGADAVIQPEVRIELSSFLFFPVSEIRARGLAVRFR